MDLRDYTLGDVVYEGTDTRVRRAVYLPSSASVVLKMPVADAPSVRVLGRIAHEHQMLTALAAVPGVARARALVRHGGALALELEDPGFRSLDRVLAERERLPLEAALRLGALVARTLDGVHAAGVIHKDVKPQNVLVDEAFEQVTLLDFGISSPLSQEATAASIPEALEGTLAYISPEQTGRTARALDARTDLYSLGVMLFEVLAGRRPFTEREPLSLVHAHLAKEPPSLNEVVAEIPPGVAAIVAKLLAKNPEQRYQTAKGAAEDLEHALRRLRESGSVEPFPLARKDFSPRLRLPQILVGREREIEQLGESFARAAAGGTELVLIGGPSGIGKTALVRSVYRAIAKAGRGLLLAGKHDQLARSTPYAAMAQAFGALMREWLASPEAVLKAWQERIRREVGDNARLIADVVPELNLVMGKLPPVPNVSGDQVLNRQKATWLDFVRAITTPNAPLVLFLDDMQWADSATWIILQALLTDVEQRALLVIAAYRDNEAPPEHPLWKLAEAVGHSGAAVSRTAVGPLSEDHVQTWLSHALECEAERVRPLARVLWQKTRGNPFFLEQLLLSFHRQKQITRDVESGAWRWDQKELEQAKVTDNVAALVMEKVQQMPEDTRRLLGLAACAEHTFHLQDLDRLSGWDRSRVTAALWPALVEELIVPVDGAYRSAQALRDMRHDVLDAEYRFLHDRVQQASYERIAPEQRVAAHLEIGRRLREQYRGAGGTPQALLQLVRHLNLGAARMNSSEERKDLARLNLEATRAAKAASSYWLMASLADTAEELLGGDRFREEPALSVELALERAEAAFFLREFDDVEARTLALLERPVPTMARLVAQELRLRSCVAMGRFSRGAEVGSSALREQGITFPETEEACGAALSEEAAETDRWAEQSPAAFDQMLLDTSLEHLLVDAVMAQCLICAGIGARPMLALLVAVRGVSETRRRNALTPAAPFMLAQFANLWSVTTGMYRRAAWWVGTALRAAERTGSPMVAECLTFERHYRFYSHPCDESAPGYERAVALGLKLGSFQGTSWAIAGDLYTYRVWRGAPLGQIDARRRAGLGLVQRAADAYGKHIFELAASLCELLMAPAGASRLLEEEPLSHGSRYLMAEGDGFVAEAARMTEAHLFLITGAASRALARALEAEAHRAMLYGSPNVTDVPLWLALASAKSLDETSDAEEQARLRGHVEHGLARFRYFAEGCAENFLHKLRLLEAEHARLSGDAGEAITKYDEAIELAREQRFLHIEALAAQLCAEFHMKQGRRHAAALYMREAKGAYTRWGALAVVAHLEAKYPALLKGHARPAEPTQATATATTASSTGGAELDVQTAVRAARALSSELDPARVVGQLMELVLENAGAQRGLLLLRDGEALSIAARLSVEEARVETGLSEPLEQGRDVAATVVQYVARTSAPVVIDDAKADVRFASDTYLAAGAVLSLLALPLTHRGSLIGVLYLEHRDMPAAFPPARVELLSVLAAQAAIAVENALLYRNLELKVKERTAELRLAKDEADRANRAKSDFLSSMSHELRTPLTGILGFAQILERMSDLPPKGREGAQVIRKSGEHLLTLINDVLDLAKIEAGKMDLAPRAVDFPILVRTVVDLCRVRAEQKGITLTYALCGAPLSRVYADDKRLTQVLLNVLGNAIKFTHQGGVELLVEVLEPTRPAGREVRFRITDTGPGIAPESLPHIFEPFEQVGDERARSEGTGLGLSITKRIVAQMGGTIEVQSRCGEGSVFTVTLVLAEAHQVESEEEAWPWETVVGYQGARRTILVVDNHAPNRELVRSLLAPLGFLVLDAEGGEEALRVAIAHRPALIVMDLSMPGMDGYEATRRLRQSPELARTIIVAFSARVSKVAREQSARAGCVDFLPKPINAGTLLRMLQRWLAIEWIHRGAGLPAPAEERATEAGPLLPPPAEQLDHLVALVNAGRVQSVMDEIERLRRQDPELVPWLEQLRKVARSYQIRRLQTFLEPYLTALSSPS